MTLCGRELKGSQEGPPWVIIAFTVNLIMGLAASQVSSMALGHDVYHTWSEVVKMLTMICLSFIMVNVGYEFTLDKSNMRQYAKDFGIAMSAAALPSFLVALWLRLALPDPLSWSLSLLSGLFAAATSAGILFSMLEAAGLKETWLFGKARVLAVFDDLGTLLLLVPLKILVSGFKWELMLEVGLVFLMLGTAYWKLHALPLRNSWRWTALYALIVTVLCKLVHYITEEHIAMDAIEMEVLLPAFTLGCITKVSHGEQTEHAQKDLEINGQDQGQAEALLEERIKTGVSMVFMLLVGLSMPSLFGEPHHDEHSSGHQHPTGTAHNHAAPGEGDHQLSPEPLALHVLAVNVLMVLGKLLPAACYKTEANLRTRIALSLGMCPRGEVGAGVIVISLGMGMTGTTVTVAVLSLAVNLMLSSAFIVAVKRLLRSSATAPAIKVSTPAAASTAAPASEAVTSGDSSCSSALERAPAGSPRGLTPKAVTPTASTPKSGAPKAAVFDLTPSSRGRFGPGNGEDYPTLLGRNCTPVTEPTSL